MSLGFEIRNIFSLDLAVFPKNSEDVCLLLSSAFLDDADSLSFHFFYHSSTKQVSSFSALQLKTFRISRTITPRTINKALTIACVQNLCQMQYLTGKAVKASSVLISIQMT